MTLSRVYIETETDKGERNRDRSRSLTEYGDLWFTLSSTETEIETKTDKKKPELD